MKHTLSTIWLKFVIFCFILMAYLCIQSLHGLYHITIWKQQKDIYAPQPNFDIHMRHTLYMVEIWSSLHTPLHTDGIIMDAVPPLLIILHTAADLQQQQHCIFYIHLNLTQILPHLFLLSESLSSRSQWYPFWNSDMPTSQSTLKQSYTEDANGQNNDDKAKKHTLGSHLISVNYCNILAYFRITHNKFKATLTVLSSKDT